MPSQLSILILEDQPIYIDVLSLRLLEDNVKAAITQVATRDAYLRALNNSKFDAIISDYVLPDINGKEALALAKQICPDTPFIIFTGSVDEETAVECMKLGAADYVLKQQPTRLVPATLSAVTRARKEVERKQTLEVLFSCEEHYRRLAENFPNGNVTIYDRNLQLTFVAGQELENSGKRADDFIGKKFQELAPPETFAIAAPHLRAAFEGETGTYETPYWGNKFYQVTVAPLIKTGGAVNEILVISQNITDRKQTEAGVKQALEWQEAVFEGSRDAVFISDSESRFVSVNKAACELTGFTRQELLTMRIPNLHEEPDQKAYHDSHERIMQGEEILSEARIRRKDGSKVDVEFNNARIIISGIAYMHTTARDITERKQTEKALRESEGHYRALAEASHDSITVVNRRWQIEYTNAFAAKQFGLSPQDLIGKRLVDILPPEIADRQQSNLQKVFESGQSLHIDAPVVFGGNMTWQSTWLVPMKENGEASTIMIVSSDITERKRAQEVLQKSKKKYQELVNTLQEGIWVIDKDANTTFVNPHMAKMLDYTVDEMQGRHLFSFMDERGTEISKRNLERRRQGIKDLHDFELLTKGGRRIHTSMNTSPILDDNGNYAGAIAAVIDITERKKAEDQIRYQALLLAHVHDAVLASDEKFILTSWNQAAERMYGWKKEEVIGKSGKEILQTEFLTQSRPEAIQQLVETGEYLGEVVNLRKDGTRIFSETRTTALRDLNGKVTGYVSVNRDITERKRAQEELESLARFPSENPSPILRVARDGALLYINQAGTSLLTDLQLQVGEPVNSYLREAVLQSLENGTKDMLEFECRERLYLFTVAPMIAFRYATLYGSDITDRKRAEGELTRSATQLRALAAHLQTIREEERTLLAREIHDQLGQTLTGLNMDLSLIKDLLQGKVTPSKLSAISKKLRGMSELTAEALQLVRKISTQLRPVILDTLGLCSAIDWQIEEFENRTGMKCKTSLPEHELDIDKKRSTALFRIFQEALTNIARHTKATKVNVMLARDNDAIVLEIQDNGAGIPEKQLSSSDSLGILGMKERALIFGGTVEVHGHPGMGTTVRARISLT